MIYKSGKNGYYKSYEYAKSILSNIQKITEFKAKLNANVIIAGIIRNEKFIIPRGDVEIKLRRRSICYFKVCRNIQFIEFIKFIK